MSISDVTIPNDLDSLWMPFTDNRSFKKQPKLFSERFANFARRRYTDPEPAGLAGYPAPAGRRSAWRRRAAALRRGPF